MPQPAATSCLVMAALLAASAAAAATIAPAPKADVQGVTDTIQGTTDRRPIPVARERRRPEGESLECRGK